MPNNITISVILCAIGAMYGMYILIRHLKIVRTDVKTSIVYAFPVAAGTLAWSSATYTFYTMSIDSEIDIARIMMLISWCMLVNQYRNKYAPCVRRR